MKAWDFKGEPPEGVAILALGGNLGDVERAFGVALDGLSRAGFDILRVSSIYRTEPVGCEPGAPEFLNAALAGLWGGSAAALLDLCKRLELEAGRPLVHERWVSRPLDLDIVALGPDEIRNGFLTVPHPLAFERAFVLKPLAEMAPELRLPGEAETASERLAKLGAESRLARLAGPLLRRPPSN